MRWVKTTRLAGLLLMMGVVSAFAETTDTSLVRRSDVPWIAGGVGLLGVSFALDLEVQEHFSNNPQEDENQDLKVFGNYAQFMGIYAAAGLYGTGLYAGNSEYKVAGKELLQSFAWTMTVVYPLKYIGGRQRPHETDDRWEYDFGKHLSFPSGHTSAAFSGATTLSLLYPHWYVILPSYSVATLVGGSRLLSNNHWFSDVVAGGLIGSGVAVLVHRYNSRKAKQTAWIVQPSLNGLTLAYLF
jgi:membrane-associated phospholipid phosphatase